MKKIVLLVVFILCVGCMGVQDEDIINSDPTTTTTKVLLNTKEYTELTKASEVREVLNSNETQMLVLGRAGCIWCDRFKEVFNKVIREREIVVYYVDFGLLAEEDRLAILDLNIINLGKCHNSGEDTDIRNGFGTPLTLFVRNNTTVDCISGHLNEASLIPRLENVGIL